MTGRFASSEADARRLAATIPHACGETAFAGARAAVIGSIFPRLELTGPCPRCRAERTLSFALSPTAPAAVSEGIREARELYGPRTTTRCPSCEGKGETYGVLGDDTAGWSDCTRCGGTGTVDVASD